MTLDSGRWSEIRAPRKELFIKLKEETFGGRERKERRTTKF